MEQNEIINKSTKIKIIVITILIFLVSVAGVTYAYFSINITGNDTASSMLITTADMTLRYTDIQIISGDDAEPGWTQTKTLTVENIGNVPATYNIIWRDLYNEIVGDELVISATCSASSGSCSNIVETPIPTSLVESHNVMIMRNISIPVGVTHTYTVTVTFKETHSVQNYNQDKLFEGTINIGEGNSEAPSIRLTTDSGNSGLSVGDVVTVGATPSKALKSSETKSIETSTKTKELEVKEKVSSIQIIEDTELKEKENIQLRTETSILNEQFYVISTNASTTTLLAKYNLLVGDVLDIVDSSYVYNKTYSPSDTGYGLQSAAARGKDGVNSSQHVAMVPFAGTNYWDEKVCQYTASTWGCSGGDGLLNYYAARGASYSGSPYPYVYVPTMSSINYVNDYTNNYGNAQNNGYTIAYFVEEYVNRLGINATGRLLSYEEAIALINTNSSIIYNGSTYWLGSVYNNRFLWVIRYDEITHNQYNFARCMVGGVRPVLVVNTSDIH